MKDHDQEARAARETLKELSQPQSFLNSMMTGVKTATTHFSGREDETTDAAEIWGRRIGRTLSLIAFIVLCAYLFSTFAR